MSLSPEEEIELFLIDSNLIRDVHSSTLKTTSMGTHSYEFKELYDRKLDYIKITNQIKLNSNALPALSLSQQELLLDLFWQSIYPNSRVRMTLINDNFG